MASFVLALDVGTSSVRAILYAAEECLRARDERGLV